MSLQSQLFRGDPKLEAAAVSDSAHILPGASGPHVIKIQQALIQVDGAAIAPDGIYGPATAAAVADFKRKQQPQILNFAGKIDNIVGIKTMAALDGAMAKRIDPVVVIGRFDVPTIPVTTSLQPSRLATRSIFGSPGVSVSSAIRSVIRGNPYVPQGASPGDGMPDSLPPRKTYALLVTVDPSLDGTGQFIELSIINSSGDNGSATVFPNRITRSATVSVTGGAQTEPGHAGQLQIQAKLDGTTVKATSAGFSVCAHPINMEENFFRDINSDTAVGVILRVEINSDSGAFTDLDKVETSEVVEQFRKDEPPFKEGSGFANNSGFGPIIPPPGKLMTDTHDEPRLAPGPKGKSNRIQLHIFNCKRCGAVNKVLPKSGYDINHEVFPVGKVFKHRVTKVGAPIGIKVGANVFNATAGLAINCHSPDHDLK
jgi:hypothetical protein